MWAKTKIVLFFAAVAALQGTLSPRIAVFGVKPDLLLILVVMWGALRGAESGGVAGFGAGFIEDLLSSGFHINALIKAVVGFVAGMIKGSVAIASTLTCAIAVAVLTLFGYLLELMIFYFFFGRPLPSVSSALSVIFLSSIYNAALTAAAFPALSALIERIGLSGSDDLREYKLYRV